MATLVFSTIGTIVGGPLGGAIGALVGRQVDGAIFGSGAKGPRLKELDITTSSYGVPLPRHFGRMRVGGTMIWATELEEHRAEQGGGGKGQPAVAGYAYSANFAIALSSRPIRDIGRIWADGKLLRGAAGDLKVAGTMRVHTGTRDQQVDPLIAAAEGDARCPAFRGLAYVVFEALDLSEFYNRIPTLTFEVIADETFGIADLVGDVLSEVEADVPLGGIDGFAAEGPPAGTLDALSPLFPLDIGAAGDRLAITLASGSAPAIALDQAAILVEDDAFGGASGTARRRLAPPEPRPAALRYYDVERDFQPGVQRAALRASAGEPRMIELPASLAASAARGLIEQAAHRLNWSRDRIAWRTASLDRRTGPGAIVTVPGRPGRWRVGAWEWREGGVELSLVRQAPAGADRAPLAGADAGRHAVAADAAPAPTQLVAFELPRIDGSGGADTRQAFVAASSSGAGWRGAALFVDAGDGGLRSLGPSGRRRSVIGHALDALPPAHPLLPDRSSRVRIALAGDDLSLPSTTGHGLAQGANLALLGEELIQFARAEPIGGGTWRLSGLLRGCGGTEAAVSTHHVGEPFVLLGADLTPIDIAGLGPAPDPTILAIGLADDEPAASALHLAGIGLRPPAPVHPRWTPGPAGGWQLTWVRRARGGWLWKDGVDVPLVEESERYRVDYGDASPSAESFVTDVPVLMLSAETCAQIALASAGGPLRVRQIGTHAVSLPLMVPVPF